MKQAVEHVKWKGPDKLRTMLVPIVDLHEDPGNVNEHDDESVGRIAASYARYGQQKPVVADANRVIRAGNGQLRAALKLGWTHLAVVESDLSGVDLAAFALADNRTAQFSRLDDQRVAELCRSLQSEADFPIEATGYTPQEVDALLERLGTAASASSDIDLGYDGEPSSEFAEGEQFSESYTVRITLPGETANDEGFKSDLATLCRRYDVEYTIKASG
jgi:hypothetical protein